MFDDDDDVDDSGNTPSTQTVGTLGRLKPASALTELSYQTVVWYDKPNCHTKLWISPLSPRPHWLVDLLVGLDKVNHKVNDRVTCELCIDYDCQ